jgi:hypothetical protein
VSAYPPDCGTANPSQSQGRLGDLQQHSANGLASWARRPRLPRLRPRGRSLGAVLGGLARRPGRRGPVGLVVQRFGPRTVERIIALEPVRANVEPDSAKLSDGWAMVLDRELPTDGDPSAPNRSTPARGSFDRAPRISTRPTSACPWRAGASRPCGSATSGGGNIRCLASGHGAHTGLTGVLARAVSPLGRPSVAQAPARDPGDSRIVRMAVAVPGVPTGGARPPRPPNSVSRGPWRFAHSTAARAGRARARPRAQL